MTSHRDLAAHRRSQTADSHWARCVGPRGAGDNAVLVGEAGGRRDRCVGRGGSHNAVVQPTAEHRIGTSGQSQRSEHVTWLWVRVPAVDTNLCTRYGGGELAAVDIWSVLYMHRKCRDHRRTR